MRDRVTPKTGATVSILLFYDLYVQSCIGQRSNAIGKLVGILAV